MKTTLEIQNLKCHGCAHTITSKLSDLENISNVEVNNDDDTVSFNYTNDTDLITVETLLLKLGYPVVGNNNSITTKAKSYVSCAIGKLK